MSHENYKREGDSIYITLKYLNLHFFFKSLKFTLKVIANFY